MHKLEFGILAIVWISVCVQSQQPDPCTSAKLFSDSSMQTNNTITAPSGSHYFGWYRYTGTATGIIATECPTGNQCGTTQQIWINDTLPQPSDGIKSLALCIRSGTSCCSRGNSLNVRNCGSFLSYYLVPMPPGTNYCFNTTADDSLITHSTSTVLPTSTTVTTVMTTESSTMQPASTTATTPKSTVIPTTPIQTVSTITTKSSSTMGTVKSTSVAPTVLFTSTTPFAKQPTMTTELKIQPPTGVISTYASMPTSVKPPTSTMTDSANTLNQGGASDISNVPTIGTIVGIVVGICCVIGVVIAVAVHLSQRSKYSVDAVKSSHQSLEIRPHEVRPMDHFNAKPRFDIRKVQIN